MEKLKKVFCCYNFLNFQCSNIFLQCSLLVFQIHSGSKAVSLKRSATSRPSVSRLCPLSRHTFNPSFTGKQVTHTRKIFSHSKFRKLQQQSTITKFAHVYFQDVEESKTIMIQYKTRREAEAAMLKSNQFTERTLRLTWHTSSLGDSAGM